MGVRDGGRGAEATGTPERRAPWWLTLLLAGGLVALFLGERVLAHVAWGRWALSGSGTLLALASAVWRLRSWRAARGEARGVEGILALSSLGCVVALGLYLVSSADGMALLGVAFSREENRLLWRDAVTVAWCALLAVSLLPALGAQWALAAHRHAGARAEEVEALRARETAAGALTVALAGAFLLLTGYVTSVRDRTVDVSYFRTATPGESTRGIVRSLAEPLDVSLFFPDVNPVQDELLGYFRSLPDGADRVRVRTIDRMAEPEIARSERVREDGVVVLSVGERSERLTFPAELPAARARLRGLDQEVQRALLLLVRERRVAYLTTGHGELNDPESGGPRAASPFREVGALRDLLRFLNYEVEELGLASGLGRAVPENAAMVLVLGPERAFLPEELAALDRYAAGGGSLLLALEPEGAFDPGPLAERLRVSYRSGPLTDDRQYLRQRGNRSDRRLIVTDRFSSHAALATIGRSRVGSGVLFMNAGYLEPAEDSGPGPDRPRAIVRSLPSTFADENGNFEFDEGAEERSSYALVVAVERDAEASEAGGGGDGELVAADGGGADDAVAAGEDAPGSEESRSMRALVFADSEIFADAVLVNLGLNAALAADAIRWLGGEEAFAGGTESEEDVPIVHTKAEDVAWFYAIILGAPVLVLGAGVGGVVLRRGRVRRRAA